MIFSWISSKIWRVLVNIWCDLVENRAQEVCFCIHELLLLLRHSPSATGFEDSELGVVSRITSFYRKNYLWRTEIFFFYGGSSSCLFSWWGRREGGTMDWKQKLELKCELCLIEIVPRIAHEPCCDFERIWRCFGAESVLLWKVCFSEDDDGLVICSSNSSELFLQFDAGAGVLILCCFKRFLIVHSA